jgi:hypothetical protein
MDKCDEWDFRHPPARAHRSLTEYETGLGQPMSVTVRLPDAFDHIRIDGNIYLAERTYVVPKGVAKMIIDICRKVTDAQTRSTD